MSLKETLLKNLPQKLVALALASALFFYVGNRKSADRILEVPLDVRNQPSFLMPVAKMRATVPIKISGLRHKITLVEAYQVNAFVDMSAAKIGDNSFFVTLRHSGLPADVTVTSKVKRIKLKMDWQQQKMVRLEPRVVNKPAAGYKIKTMRITPDRVMVAGPASVLKRITRLLTRPVNISGIRGEFERVVEPDFSGKNLFLKQPQKIMLKIEVSEKKLVKEFEKMPVMVTGLPAGLRIAGTKSFFVRVVYSGTRRQLRTIRADKILFAADLSKIKNPGTYKIEVLKNTNAGAFLQRMEPKNITVKLVKE